MKPRIAVIGGGAAGMTAAVYASQGGGDVTLFERNDKFGRKLGITGKGRCNVTNNCTREEMLASVVRNPRFLYSALSFFDMQDTIRFFEERGVPLKTERGGRVFPVSDRAADIVNALRRSLTCRVVHERVTGIRAEDGKVAGVETAAGFVPFDRVIVCTGGLSYPSTGSDGDGLRFAEALGLAVTPPQPSLCPLETVEHWCMALSGLSLKNVTLTVFDGNTGKKVYSELGEMLFTHFGVSGPLVLSASAHLDGITPGRWRCEIDLKPALDEKTLDARLLREIAAAPNKAYTNLLGTLLPSSMTHTFAALSGIDGTKKAGLLTREERQRIAQTLHHLPFTVRAARPIEEAIVTRGGVSVKELDPRTMESKKIAGLYFAGEVVDVDAYTGGFNLQIAFSTGSLAGKSAAEEEITE